MYEVVKIQGGYAVRNWKDEFEIAYKNKKNAQQYAYGSECGIIIEAELYNERFDRARDYLATRVGRIYKPFAQMELF
jgi:hypothetical protein